MGNKQELQVRKDTKTVTQPWQRGQFRLLMDKALSQWIQL